MVSYCYGWCDRGGFSLVTAALTELLLRRREQERINREDKLRQEEIARDTKLREEEIARDTKRRGEEIARETERRREDLQQERWRHIRAELSQILAGFLTATSEYVSKAYAWYNHYQRNRPAPYQKLSEDEQKRLQETLDIDDAEAKEAVRRMVALNESIELLASPTNSAKAKELFTAAQDLVQAVAQPGPDKQLVKEKQQVYAALYDDYRELSRRELGS